MKKLITIIIASIFILGTNYANAQLSGLKNKIANKAAKVDILKSGNKTSSNTSDYGDNTSDNSTNNYSSYFTSQYAYTDDFSKSGGSAKNIDGYKLYEEKKQKYSQNTKNSEYTNSIIEKINEFYNNYIPNTYIPYVTQEINKNTKSPFDESIWKVNPEPMIQPLSESITDIDSVYLKLCKDQSIILELKNKLVSQKEIIEKYIVSDEYAKYKAKVAEEEFNARLLGKSGMTDASVNALVIANVDKAQYGTVTRVVITSKVWDVITNDYGIPALKRLWVDFATKKSDGKCYLNSCVVERAYEGGGSYGGMYVDQKNIHFYEMNCNNVNK